MRHDSQGQRVVDSPSGGQIGEKQMNLILASIDRLPTLPAVAMRLMSIVGVEDIDLDEVIRLIESDPALSSTILSMCRTADKGLGDKITTVRRAVIMLGLEAVQVAALSVHVYQQFSSKSQGNQGNKEDDGQHFDQQGLWVHSLAVACCCEQIAEFHPDLGVEPEQAYLAGLLHDVGKMALDMVLPQAYERVLSMSASRHCPLSLIEQSVLGFDHHTAGKRLAEHWKLPSAIRDAIWLHSQPIDALPKEANRALVSVVTLGEAWASDMHLGWTGDCGMGLDLYELADRLKIKDEFFKDRASRVFEGVSKRGEILGLGEHAEQDMLIESLTAANRTLATLNTKLRKRGKAGDDACRLMEAMGVFNADLHGGESVEEVICAMVLSASVLVGSNRAAVIFQHRPDDPWQSMIVDQGKAVLAAHRVSVPDCEHGEVVRPGMLADANAAQSMELASLDWLRELFMAVKEIGSPMLLGSKDAHDGPLRDLPSFVIIMPKTGSGIERVVMQPGFAGVRDLWKRALVEAVLAERSRRLGEELAGANHALTALRHELTQTESLVQLGKMASGAAHEMNTPLAVIRGRSQQLFERLGTKRERESARAIAAAADDLTDMITSLHLIADPPKPSISMNDPVLLVRQAIEIARDRCMYQGVKAKIQFKVDGHVSPIPMDIDLLSKAIAEPIINAVQANPHAIVMVCIESAMSNDRLKVRITDYGPGFTSHSMKHAFEPFFSELDAGRRSGLGLSRARGVIELHRGEILLGNHSRKGTGGEVEILLNRALDDQGRLGTYKVA